MKYRKKGGKNFMKTLKNKKTKVNAKNRMKILLQAERKLV